MNIKVIRTLKYNYIIENQLFLWYEYFEITMSGKHSAKVIAVSKKLFRFYMEDLRAEKRPINHSFLLKLLACHAVFQGNTCYPSYELVIIRSFMVSSPRINRNPEHILVCMLVMLIRI